MKKKLLSFLGIILGLLALLTIAQPVSAGLLTPSANGGFLSPGAAIQSGSSVVAGITGSTLGNSSTRWPTVFGTIGDFTSLVTSGAIGASSTALFTNGFISYASSTLQGTFASSLTSPTVTANTILQLLSAISCSGSNALQTDGSGNVACGGIANNTEFVGDEWKSSNTNQAVSLATTTFRTVVGASTTPYAKFSIIAGSSATTTFAVLPNSGATADTIHIYDSTGALSTIVGPTGAWKIGGQFGASSTALFTSGFTSYASSTLQAVSAGGNALFLGTLQASSTSLFTNGFTAYASSTLQGLAATSGLFSSTLGASSTALFTSGLTAYASSTFQNISVTGLTNSGSLTLGGVFQASSTALFGQGFTAYASSTLQNFTAAGALTWNGSLLGIGTTSPYALLSVHETASNINETAFAIGSTTPAGANVSLFSVKKSGEQITGGGTPVVSSCGSGPSGSVVGNDTAGTVTIGGGIVLSCVVTFSTPKVGTIHPMIQADSSTVTGGPTSKSSTGFTVTFSASLGGGTFDYYVPSN